MEKHKLIDLIPAELKFIPERPSEEWKKNLADSLENFGNGVASFSRLVIIFIKTRGKGNEKKNF